jgi:hypothetical protein
MSGSTECQIASGIIGKREYFFTDTPGFDDEHSSLGVCLKIVRMIDEIRTHIDLVGVWYVVDNTASRNPWIEAKFVDWLVAFCGEDYFPHITFVTTHWNCIDDQQFAQCQHKLEQRKITWETFISKGAETYQHGKVYTEGVETSVVPTLSWYRDKDVLRTNARDMVQRRCSGPVAASTQAIRELSEGKASVEISAANIFRLPMHWSSASGQPSGRLPQRADPPEHSTQTSGGTTSEETSRASQAEGTNATT